MTSKTDDVSALARLREKLAGMTPGPLGAVERDGRVFLMSKHVRHPNADGLTWHDVAYLCTTNGCGIEDAEGFVASISLARFVADEGTVAKVTQMVEQAMWSPASGPVSWTDDKVEAAREQAAYLARSVLVLIASAGEEA